MNGNLKGILIEAARILASCIAIITTAWMVGKPHAENFVKTVIAGEHLADANVVIAMKLEQDARAPLVQRFLLAESAAAAQTQKLETVDKVTKDTNSDVNILRNEIGIIRNNVEHLTKQQDSIADDIKLLLRRGQEEPR